MKIRNNNIKIFISLGLCFLVLLSVSACSKKSQKETPVKYKKDALREIEYKYPKTYKEDYRNESQVSYLLNGNEGIIFIIRWDEGIETDMDTRGKPKKVNDIDGYYWIDQQDKSYNFGFKVKTQENNSVAYFVSADNEEIFWNLVNSIRINSKEP